MIIAIDGPAGAGKGTIAGYLALNFNLLHLDTGLLYRALAKAVIDENINPCDIMSVSNIARTLTIQHTQNPGLRTEQIAAVASQIAVIREVREILEHIQRTFCKQVKLPYKGAVLDGRDIGTVICPEADCKLFITARPEIRIRRRHLEILPDSQNTKQLSQNMSERDNRDITRQIAPLTPAPEACIIDTSNLSIDEACMKAARYVTEKCIKDPVIHHPDSRYTTG